MYSCDAVVAKLGFWLGWKDPDIAERSGGRTELPVSTKLGPTSSRYDFLFVAYRLPACQYTNIVHTQL